MKNSPDVVEIQADEGRHILARMLAKAFSVCVFSLIIGIFSGLSGSNYLIAWPILSVLFLWLNTEQTLKTALSGEAIKSWGASVIAFGTLVPWTFSVYLFFYRGLWRLTDILDGFSWLIIGEASIFVFMGYSLINAIYQLSEIGRKATEKTFA